MWSTASFGEDAATSPMELATLGEHLDLCQKAKGRLFLLRCKAESVGNFFTSRVITSVTLFLLFAALVYMAV
jgi:hypothetical protein